MTSTEEPQAISNLSEISKNIRALMAPMQEWVLKQGEADEKTLWADHERRAQALAIARGRHS